MKVTLEQPKFYDFSLTYTLNGEFCHYECRGFKSVLAKIFGWKTSDNWITKTGLFGLTLITLKKVSKIK